MTTTQSSAAFKEGIVFKLSKKVRHAITGAIGAGVAAAVPDLIGWHWPTDAEWATIAVAIIGTAFGVQWKFSADTPVEDQVLDVAKAVATKVDPAGVVKVEKIAHGPLGAIVKADLVPLAAHYGIDVDQSAPALRKAITAAEKALD